ncbi:hypothetical protein N7509_005102 [Penicillium cosmopolitanum]|uniref:Uncharacterized protein n=1 Tax=Penicillium cosmopolitanum TaxID=1131564 RepID=A0A9W9W1M2_9EURO|nr:uncharacterized protein N7509_005102 [Penicillium cosmopolitanum]KAJ5396989.1 hypothetical protein N7509_005102 [Penicillium cosmopolitanum]
MASSFYGGEYGSCSLSFSFSQYECKSNANASGSPVHCSLDSLHQHQTSSPHPAAAAAAPDCNLSSASPRRGRLSTTQSPSAHEENMPIVSNEHHPAASALASIQSSSYKCTAKSTRRGSRLTATNTLSSDPLGSRQRKFQHADAITLDQILAPRWCQQGRSPLRYATLAHALIGPTLS